jgi:hypothetical protein
MLLLCWLVLLKHKCLFANDNDITIGQHMRLDLLPIYLCAVRTIQIIQDISSGFLVNLDVTTRGEFVINNDMIGAAAPDRDWLVLYREAATMERTFDRKQLDRHIEISPCLNVNNKLSVPSVT